MAGPPVYWPLLSSALSPTGGLRSPDRAARFNRQPPRRPTPEVRFMSHPSHASHGRVTARQRRFASVIWASFLVFVFVAGIASRIWLR
jgi:hypothetical protein